MSKDPDEFMQGGGAPSVKFAKVGDSVTGIIVSAVVTEQTDLDFKAKTYADGNPMEQLEITLLTDERDAEVSNDDGSRRIYAKGQMRAVIRDAQKAAGAKWKTANGRDRLTVTYVGDKASTTRGYSPAKQFSAAYDAGLVSVSNAADSFMADNNDPF